MRVLIINSLYPPLGSGGAERSVAELSDGLIAQGVSVAVATLAPPDWDVEQGRAVTTDTGVVVYRWRPPGRWAFSSSDSSVGQAQKMIWHARECYRPSARSFIRAVIHDFAPDVVHSNNIAGFGVAVLHEIRTRAWVHTLRDYYLLCPRTTRFKGGGRCGGGCFDCRFFARARCFPVKPPDELVAVSQSVLDVHRSAGLWVHVPASVVPNEPALASIPKRRIQRIRAVGFIGRIDEAKGVAVLLKAFEHPALASLDLLLAGSLDAEAQHTLERSLATGRVRHLGLLPAEEFFRKVDLVVVPSQWDEPFGRVAAEAGSIGLPVLVSQRGGLPEATAGLARAAVVGQVEDPHAWTEAIVQAESRWTNFDVGSASVSSRTHVPYLEVYRRAVSRLTTKGGSA